MLNISNKDLEAALVNAAPTADPFVAGTTVYTRSTAANAAAGGAEGTAGVGDRVRIFSQTGTTLRVQSYMVVGTTVMDTSNGQGVDFEFDVNDRVTNQQLDATPISQDAINGLAR